MRAFLIGNGPSLRRTPLELLENEVSFGVNRINLLYPETSWRPTDYVRVETPNDDNPDDFWQDCWLHVNMGLRCHFPKAWIHTLGVHDNIHYFNSCHHYKYSLSNSSYPRAWHMPMICDFGTVITVAMQVAIQAGYDELYLLGCDLGYGVAENHFYDSSGEQRQPPETANTSMYWAHKNAFRYCRDHGVRVANCTYGGELEVWPRMKLEEVLNGG